MEILVTNEPPPSYNDQIIERAIGKRLWIPGTDYPDQNEWADRAYRELQAGTKRVMVAIENTNVIGSVIYQRHKIIPDTLEIKRISVQPESRGRLIASFLLRNTEIEGARQFLTKRVVLDAKAKNTGIKMFLLSQHYVIVGQEDLYKLGAGDDLIFEKELKLSDVEID